MSSLYRTKKERELISLRGVGGGGGGGRRGGGMEEFL